MAFFMIGAVHMALMILVMKVAGTMVSGWSVFGLAGKAAEERADIARSAPALAMAGPAAGLAIDQARVAGQRQIRLASGAPAAANDPGAPSSARRETRVVGPAVGPAASSSGSFQSRARGVGSRFRAAPPRRSEKVK
jgi:type IV secretion system protein VirB6